MHTPSKLPVFLPEGSLVLVQQLFQITGDSLWGPAFGLGPNANVAGACSFNVAVGMTRR